MDSNLAFGVASNDSDDRLVGPQLIYHTHFPSNELAKRQTRIYTSPFFIVVVFLFFFLLLLLLLLFVLLQQSQVEQNRRE